MGTSCTCTAWCPCLYMAPWSDAALCCLVSPPILALCSVTCPAELGAKSAFIVCWQLKTLQLAQPTGNNSLTCRSAISAARWLADSNWLHKRKDIWLKIDCFCLNYAALVLNVFPNPFSIVCQNQLTPGFFYCPLSWHKKGELNLPSVRSFMNVMGVTV